MDVKRSKFEGKSGTIVQFNYKSELIGTEVKTSGLFHQNRDSWQLCVMHVYNYNICE